MPAGKKQNNLVIIIILGVLNAITPFSIDMYLPAFPEISHQLHTTVAKIALSVSTYFVGFALGQVIYGPLLDRFGRKRPLYAGLLLYIAGCGGCMISASLGALLFFRFVQALGGCVASVGAIAMVRDFFSVGESAKIYSLLILILGTSPLLAPTVGGFIVTAWGWPWVFALLAIIALIMLLVVFFFLPEGHPADQDVSLKMQPILQNFRSILREPQFYIYVLAGSLSLSGLFVYVAGSPAIFMNGFRVSAKLYGGIFALLSVSFIGGSQLNHLAVRKYKSEKIFRSALIWQVIFSGVFLIVAATVAMGLMLTLFFLFINLFCIGLSNPNASAVALAPFTKNAGSASSLLGFIQIGLGALTSACVGMLPFKAILSTAAIMAFTTFIGWLILFFGENRRRRLVEVKNATVAEQISSNWD